MRDASDRPAREVCRCECCGADTIIAIEGLFRNPQPGSRRVLFAGVSPGRLSPPAGRCGRVDTGSAFGGAWPWSASRRGGELSREFAVGECVRRLLSVRVFGRAHRLTAGGRATEL